MTDKPILFSGPMVRAIIEGRKTQTRRAIPEKMQEAYDNYDDWCRNVSAGVPTSRQWEREFFLERCRCAPGDVLWVREAWRTLQKWDCLAPRHLAEGRGKITYEADVEHRNPLWAFGKLRPSMFMPRWASRLTLIVESVKVERLQEITEEDAIAEGVSDTGRRDGAPYQHFKVIGFPEAGMEHEPVPVFSNLWEAINGPGSWEANPWVAAITFRSTLANVDSPEAR